MVLLYICFFFKKNWKKNVRKRKYGRKVEGKKGKKKLKIDLNLINYVYIFFKNLFHLYFKFYNDLII